MICIKTEHFRLIRIVLLAIGLWPYQQSRFVQLQIILSFGMLISFVIVQLATFVTSECTPDIIIKVLSVVLCCSCMVIEYNSLWINVDNIKHLLERLQYISNELKDENEIAIIKKYGNDAERYTILLLMSTIICGIYTILSSFWPSMFDIIFYMNESKHDTMHIMTEYFVDRKRYFYLISWHTNITICIGGLTLTATTTMLITYVKHVCGMFKIASYRIEQAMTIKMLENITFGNEVVIHKKIICAIDIHCKAMKFSEFLSSSFEGSLFLLIIFAVGALSLNLFAVSRNALLGNKEEFMLHFVIVIGIFVGMFLGNYIGQELIDHNNRIYFTAYKVQWYIAPVHTQKLLLFILQRGNKAFNMNIGGLFVPSLEYFAAMTKASMSYFTVIYSMQY